MCLDILVPDSGFKLFGEEQGGGRCAELEISVADLWIHQVLVMLLTCMVWLGELSITFRCPSKFHLLVRRR